MQVAKNKVVGIHYTISIGNNEIIYSTWGFDPEEYLHGSSSIFPAVAKALEGHVIGDELDLILAPSEAYGIKNEQLVYEIDNKQFGDIEKFEVGDIIQIPGGQEALLIQKKDQHLLVDANHPLAGKELHYTITVESIRDAADHEIKWGRTDNEIKACSGEPGCC
jgi:FKBP-type peptidyl-prolyl cis-trans isomerase SlyD